jgi:hypothetical protein
VYLLWCQSVAGEDILNAIHKEPLLPITPHSLFVIVIAASCCFAGSFSRLTGLARRSPFPPLAVVEAFVKELELHEQRLLS